MGRPERPLDPEAGPLARFALDLREVRRAAGGLSYRQLARRAHYSVTALSEAAGGEQLPTLAVTLAYVDACGGDRQAWEARWHAVAAELAPEVAKPDDEFDDGDGVQAPYLGLSAFQPEDADRFFGREQLVAELLQRLEHRRFLAVFGTSGSGKSSILRAGLLPAISAGKLPGSRHWRTVLFAPGEHPLEELAIRVAALQGIAPGSLYDELTDDPSCLGLAIRQALAGAPAGAELLIVVDQFEELFTLCQGARERSQFVDALLGAAGGSSGRARVVLGVRADFYAHCADYPALVAALRDAQVLVGPMGLEDLRSAIVKPAAGAGLKVTPELVATILADAAGEPGGLPLVSHALRETWRRRPNGTLTLTGYQAAGGVRGAIAQTAERVYQSLDPAKQQLARRIFLRLCALGEGTEDTRRRIHPSELQSLASPHETTLLLERLAGARLVALGEDTVEIAHEALIREWPRLRQWLTEDREGLRIHRQLTEAALGWESLGRDPGSLYRGSRLAVAREWADRDGHREELNPLERSFLDASSALEASERSAMQRRTRRLRQLTAALAVMLVIALAAGGLALHQRQIAVSRQLAASAESLATTQPPAAALLSAAAFRRAPTAEARGSLLSLAARQSYDAILAGHAGLVRTVAFSPDGRTLASGGLDRTVILWDVRRRARMASLSGHGDTVRSVAFSPDGGTLASASKDGTVRLWDVARRQEVATLTGHTGAVYDVAFSPDGGTLASVSKDGTVKLWDVAGREATATLAAHADEVYAVAFSPDGRTLASGSKDRTVRLWDVARRQEVVSLNEHTGEVHDVAFSPDGRTLASGGQDWKVMLWDPVAYAPLATFERRGRQEGHTGVVQAVAFSPHGALLASGGLDGRVIIWDMAARARLASLVGHTSAIYGIAYSADGTLASASFDHTVILWPDRPPFSGHTDVVNAVAFSPRGRTLASSSKDGTIRLWDVAARKELARLTSNGNGVGGVAFSRDGRLLASSSADGTIKLWDVDRRQEVVTLTGHNGSVTGVAFSRDGRLLASSSGDRTVKLWDVGARKELATLAGHGDVVHAAAFSPNGRILASGGLDRKVILWDVARRMPTAILAGHSDAVRAVAFSPDGRLLAAASSTTVTLWDVARRKDIRTLNGHAGPVTGVAFSPDGRLLASSSLDETTVLWDPAGGARVATLTGNVSSLSSVAFSPDGRLLAAGGWDKRVVVWNTDAETAVEQVCRVVGHSPMPGQRTPLTQAISHRKLCG